MLDFPRWKIWGITLICVIGVLLAIPSLFPKSVVDKWPGWIPSARISLGLDLAGGSHLLLEADTSDVAKQQIETMEETLRTELRRAEPRIEIAPGVKVKVLKATLSEVRPHGTKPAND